MRYIALREYLFVVMVMSTILAEFPTLTESNWGYSNSPRKMLDFVFKNGQKSKERETETNGGKQSLYCVRKTLWSRDRVKQGGRLASGSNRLTPCQSVCDCIVFLLFLCWP